ncbi:MAG: hypothetical protein RIK87_17570 [Fuerstiella sp.]
MKFSVAAAAALCLLILFDAPAAAAADPLKAALNTPPLRGGRLRYIPVLRPAPRPAPVSQDRPNYYEDELNIAPVARFDDLPLRLFLRPEFQPAARETYLSEEQLQTFITALEGDYDTELYFLAARSLERVAREQLADTELFAPALRARLEATTQLQVRRACALALAEAGQPDDAALLARFCQPGDEVLSQVLERRLAEWKSDVLLSTWKSRIQSPDGVSRKLVVLACEGAAAVEAVELTEALQALAVSDQVSPTVRKSAAAAVAKLSPAEAMTSATALLNKDIFDRVVAVTLLQTADKEASLNMAGQLCADPEDAVASLAWKVLLQQNPERLLSRLEEGRAHRDPNVRSVVVKAIGLLPSAERCDMLNDLMADPHIGVRNEARNTLQMLAKQDDTLRQRACGNACDVTANAESSWQQLEQAMLLLGGLRHDACLANCVPLLQHERPEVLVTAAWMLHLMPEPSLAEAAAAEAVRKWDAIRNLTGTEIQRRAYDEQLAYLCEIAAWTGRTEVSDLCREQFDKESGLSSDSRAVALWTLGMLMADSRDSQLKQMYVERVFDDGLPPEVDIVKSASALSLGLLGSPDAIPDLRRAHDMYGVGGMLGNCVSTALTMLGEQAPPRPEIVPFAIGGWPIAPLIETR